MPYVHLNVGGTLYATSKMTLEKIGDSMLAKLCQPCWEEGSGIGTTRENPIIIDRNGKMFEYILDYLRQEIWFTFPNADSTFYKQLFTEAHYFGISALCEEIYENYLHPNNIWISPAGFKPMEGQEATLRMENDELMMRLALFLAASADLKYITDDILYIEKPGWEASIDYDCECAFCGWHHLQWQTNGSSCSVCINCGRPSLSTEHIHVERDHLVTQLSSATATFVRIPSDSSEPNMVDVKFVMGGEEHPKKGYVVRMSLWNFRAPTDAF